MRQALLALESRPAPAGEIPVVLGPGWPGILLHEAIGHGLEGDFNRKKTSAFSGLMGQRIASPGVTVVDDGTLPDRRGSITVDDEGTPSGRTVMIEDGILTGFIQDRMNARLMGVTPTGNGRRQSYAHVPMPRMTNTIMLGGDCRYPEEMIRSVKNGLYAVNFGGGQVDITSGKFVFSASEAYLIEDGKVTAPVKGATLIGNGPDALTRIEMVGNDPGLDPGIGTCGKNGQGVPVGVGQPTMKLSGLTVGGTASLNVRSCRLVPIVHWLCWLARPPRPRQIRCRPARPRPSPPLAPAAGQERRCQQSRVADRRPRLVHDPGSMAFDRPRA